MPDDLNDTRANPVEGDTRPNSVKAETQQNPVHPGASKRFPRWLVIFVVLVFIVLGIIGGYGSGMTRRYAAQNTQISGQLQDQYQLGMQAMNAGNYAIAEQYFKFILQTDANFPGIQAAYADLLLKMNATATPEYSPSPLVSPTPDLRGAEQIFNAAQQSLNSSNWDDAITNLDSLRKSSPTYRTAEVDGMYYTALRQRGVAKITAACQDANLEGGIYDLTLAEQFIGNGNLDSVAQSLRTYARLYIIGASFWDQDWVQAQNFFAQVMAGYPNMSDSSCLTATKRWYQATIKYAEQLTAAGNVCAAATQYAAALSVNDPYNPTALPTVRAVQNKCHPPVISSPTPAEGTPTTTENPTGVFTTATPTETPTPTP